MQDFRLANKVNEVKSLAKGGRGRPKRLGEYDIKIYIIKRKVICEQMRNKIKY